MILLADSEGLDQAVQLIWAFAVHIGLKTLFFFFAWHSPYLRCTEFEYTMLGPVVQSVVSLMSSIRVISLTILADSIYNILIFFAEKM